MSDAFGQFYTDAERAVFGYRLGGETLYADPAAVRRRLVVALRGNPNAVIEQSNSEDPVARAAAEERLWPAVRAAFGLPPFDPQTGEGTTDAVCERLLDEFLDWSAQKKMTPPPSPTGFPPTAASRAPGASITPPPTASC